MLMRAATSGVVHPGPYIRDHVIPRGMSVKDAAQRLGVGRPALSNLLNGNSSLSAEMAVRLEKAFGADRQTLVNLQASFDRYQRRAGDREVAVRAYVPAFLTIKARQIHDWAEGNIEARQHLPVLLRKLVHSTGHDLRQVDFPGYDNAERQGWDGLTDTGAATAWVPEGRCCWEFGVNQNPRTKAESDYTARLSSVSPAERAAGTFVFVTPRNWPGKAEWVAQKNAAGDWKAVRAYDASDLEQWLEESIPGQIWLAEKLGLALEGIETLDQCWHRWASASEPPMAAEVFGPSIAAYRPAFKDWLERPSDRPFIIAADSKDEALAFLACLFQDREIASSSEDLPVLFRRADPLKVLSASSSPFIPIVCNEEAERELVGLYRRFRSIVVRPRNAVESAPDVILDLLSHDAFEKAVGAMEINRDEAGRLARESGRSPTILRRRLSKIDAIRVPPWAGEADIARCLIPLVLIGVWHAKSDADREVLSVLGGRPFPEIESDIARLLQFDDCPVWSAGQYRGVASKIDALFAINRWLTDRDFDEFFWLAEYVLSESDPALELPEDRRWAAGIYGKVRHHSAALREGICETLVILSVHGNSLFQARLGIDVELRVSSLIQRLLTPLTLEKSLSHNDDLPRYAEAAPDAFLRLIEADLKETTPVVLGLLKPVDSGIFGGCPRTGLLWALECLAWRPQNLARVTNLLARLSRTAIEDNWANKPIASLHAIYRSWMPQTAASLEERMKGLEVLVRNFPDIGWQIATEQFEPHSRIGHYSYRPRWRGDASGAGQPVTFSEVHAFTRKALDLAIGWPNHDEATLGNLVECLAGMPEEDQSAVWDLIDKWSKGGVSEPAKAELRERIRRTVAARRPPKRKLKGPTRDRAQEAYAKLEPRDPVIRHAWLFANQWVQESAGEIADENFDFSQHAARIHERRVEAMKEIWREKGYAGIDELLTRSDAPQTIGQYLASCVPLTKDSVCFLHHCLAVQRDLASKIDGCMQGLLLTIDGGALDGVLSNVAKDFSPDWIVRVLRCAPFSQQTWRALDRHGEFIRTRYWREVHPYWNRHSPAELTELIDRLLEVDRPRAAFQTVHMDWTDIETSRLKRLLKAVVTTDAEPAGRYRLSPHDISAALQSLDGRAGVTQEEMAQLEFMFMEALAQMKHGIPNLERKITDSLAMFVQAFALVFKRSNSGEDPPELQIQDPDRRSAVATAAYRLLDQIKLIPGTGSDGNIDVEALWKWVTEARDLCSRYGRAEIGDQ